MSNQRDLKAFVRYDGSGRVVAGSLVLRKNKPKVGKWKEIQAYECCNYIPSTTTTTTTQGGVTPTAFVQPYWLNTEDACTTTTYGSLVFYSASSTLGEEVSIFLDAALTIPVPYGYVINDPGTMTNYLVGEGGYVSVFECSSVFSEAAIGNFVANDACSGIGSPTTVWYSGSLGNGTALYLDAGLTVPYDAGSFPSGPGTYLRIYFNAAFQVCTMSGNVIFDYLPC